MASIRRLKKDIQFLSAELIGDCLDFLETFPEAKETAKEKKVMAIIEEAVYLHNNIIDRAIHPEGKDNHKLVKEFYKQLKKDFIQDLDKEYKKLEALLKKE